MAKQIVTGENSRQAGILLRRERALPDAGKDHARPQGPQCRDRKEVGAPIITKDGVTVAKEIRSCRIPSRTWARRWFVKSLRRRPTSLATAPPLQPCSQ